MISLSTLFTLFTLTGVVLVMTAIGGNDSFASVNNNTSPITLSVLQQPKIHEYTLVAEETTLEILPVFVLMLGRTMALFLGRP